MFSRPFCPSGSVVFRDWTFQNKALEVFSFGDSLIEQTDSVMLNRSRNEVQREVMPVLGGDGRSLEFSLLTVAHASAPGEAPFC